MTDERMTDEQMHERLSGAGARWREANADPATKIGRPQQLYVGPAPRSWPTGR